MNQSFSDSLVAPVTPMVGVTKQSFAIAEAVEMARWRNGTLTNTCTEENKSNCSPYSSNYLMISLHSVDFGCVIHLQAYGTSPKLSVSKRSRKIFGHLTSVTSFAPCRNGVSLAYQIVL